ncbi:MAG: ABC transporter ATP-binding protein [Clostridia bacterium]|nr:ABC transporter ATP-binding protein [Clostridia bacterium]
MNAIEIKNLCKSYGSFRLENVDLTLPCGCIMGLIGENGAGKSTTINLLLDIIKKDSGEIRVFDKEMTADAKEIKNDIGVVLDEPCFPEQLKGLQINKIMKKTYKNWNEETFFSLLKRFDIDEKKKFKSLSKGMKMKMSIAVALSHDAKLLILDEPTSGLDPVIRDEIVDIFYEFTRNPTNSILISSHIVSDLEKLCDYIAFIHKGKVILCDEKDRLLEKYCVIHCTAEELSQFSDDAVMHKKESPYGVEAIVERYAADGFETNPVGIEELFVAVVKEAK